MVYCYSTISANSQYLNGASGTHSAMIYGNDATNAGIVYLTPDNVHPQIFPVYGNPGHYPNTNSFAYSVTNNDYLVTNPPSVQCQMFNANGNPGHNPSANSSAYSVVNNGYLGTNAAHAWVAPQAQHPQRFYSTANPAPNLTNPSGYPVINIDHFAPIDGNNYSVLNAEHPQMLYPRPEREIVHMSVEEIADWIRVIGTFKNWDSVDCDNIRSKLIEYKINGRKIMEMKLEDFERTCNIDKLGLRLTIRKIVLQEVSCCRNSKEENEQECDASSGESTEAIYHKSGRRDEDNDIEMKRCRPSHIIPQSKEQLMCDSPSSSSNEDMWIPAESTVSLSDSSFSTERVLENLTADVTPSAKGYKTNEDCQKESGLDERKSKVQEKEPGQLYVKVQKDSKSAQGKLGACNRDVIARATSLRNSSLKLTLQLDKQHSVEDLLGDFDSKFKKYRCKLTKKFIDRTTAVYIVKFKSIMMAQEALLVAAKVGYKTTPSSSSHDASVQNTLSINGARQHSLEPNWLGRPTPENVCKFIVLSKGLTVRKGRLLDTDAVKEKKQDDVVYVNRIKGRRARLVTEPNGRTVAGWASLFTKSGIPLMEQVD